MKQSGCIIVVNTVTGICNVEDRDAQMCTASDMAKKVTISAIPGDHLTISKTLSFEKPSLLFKFVEKKIYSNHGRRHGELVQNDVAKCSEHSSLNVGIRSVWIAFLLGKSHCRQKLILSRYAPETDTF
ncbi:hypothetical protein KIN20_003997 [Parelaphostrongylus tenuis]|uniref:Uncharacterized protein n=1 Tax=Parelaphostrongylus tenuis TaxID=148309 RepID=A0AAD5LXQ3_PARTN|nr:hypothetical protein KIN20_003997 [Parelaphostrongylus tenuis]